MNTTTTTTCVRKPEPRDEDDDDDDDEEEDDDPDDDENDDDKYDGEKDDEDDDGFPRGCVPQHSCNVPRRLPPRVALPRAFRRDNGFTVRCGFPSAWPDNSDPVRARPIDRDIESTDSDVISLEKTPQHTTTVV